jgi:uncharacterized protein YjiS (DUF1127 family)
MLARTVPAVAARTPARARLPLDWAGLLDWIRLCLARRRERRELAALTDAELKDIGVDRAEALAECARWPWEGSLRR